MAFNALLFMQSWFYLDVLLEIVMNKIYRLKWNRSRNCWSVCSELGSRVKGKKSRAVLISAISLYSSLVFADDVIVNQDKTIDFGKENQSIDYRITVTDKCQSGNQYDRYFPSASDSRFWWWVGYYRRKGNNQWPA